MEYSKRSWMALPFGCLMGYLLLLGDRYARDAWTDVGTPRFFYEFLAVSLLLTALLSLLLHFLPWFDRWMNRPVISAKQRGFKTYALILTVTGGIYFITFLAVYPGIYSYDASVQILQFFGDMPVTNHHPLLHTLFLCGCLKLGGALFHSYQAGMAIHSAVQAALVGAVLSYVIWRMIKKGRPFWFVLLSYLFLVVNPYVQILVFTTTKDVLFGCVFLLFFLCASDMVCDIEHFCDSLLLQARLFITALFMCLLRNQGIYVLLLFALCLFLWLLYKKKRHNSGVFKDVGHDKGAGLYKGAGIYKGSAVLLAAAVLYAVFTGPVFTFIGVEQGDMREMLSVPMQQLARAYSEERERLTDEEVAYIEELIPPAYLEQYVSVNADLVKSGFRTEVLKSDPKKFLTMWWKIGVKMPSVYADSFLMGNWGYWYPGATQYWINYLLFDGAFMSDEFNVLRIHRDSKFPQYEAYLRNISLTPAFETIPGLSVILNQAFPFYVMLVASAALLYRKDYKLLLPLLLPFAYFGTLLLGPVTSYRYVFPLVLCVPSLFEQILAKERPKGLPGEY